MNLGGGTLHEGCRIEKGGKDSLKLLMNKKI